MLAWPEASSSSPAHLLIRSTNVWSVLCDRCCPGCPGCGSERNRLCGHGARTPARVGGKEKPAPAHKGFWVATLMSILGGSSAVRACGRGILLSRGRGHLRWNLRGEEEGLPGQGTSICKGPEQMRRGREKEKDRPGAFAMTVDSVVCVKKSALVLSIGRHPWGGKTRSVHCDGIWLLCGQ